MRRFFLLIMALLLAGCTTYFFHTYLKSVATTPATTQVAMTDVVVAKEAIPDRTQITGKMVEVQKVPTNSLQPDAVTTLDQVVGKWTLVAIQPNEMLLSHHVVAADKATTLSYKIKPGDRAFTVTAGRIADTVANLVKPGDHVDVLLRAKTDSAVVVSDILVLAVDQRMSDSPPDATASKGSQGQAYYTMTTVEVSPSDAMKLVQAEEKGDLQLILRSASPGA